MQNRVPLLFALGTCYASAALAAPPTSADLVVILLAGLAVGDPVRAGSLEVFPLAARDPLREPATRIVTLGEALERAWLTLRVERSEPCCEVLLQSWADAAILVTAGEELPGSGGLVAARDVLVPPGARGLGVPAMPAPGIAAAVDERSWQRRVRALEVMATGFPSGCEGVMVVEGDRAARIELFPSAWLLSRARAGILRAAAFAAVDAPAHPPLEREDAEGLLREVSAQTWVRRAPVGLGFEVEAAGPGVSACALFLGGALVHLAAVLPAELLLLEAPEAGHP
jgi:hypothetical protein